MVKETLYPYQNKSLVSIRGERWKDIPGFEGYYQASNMGRIKSCDRTIPHPRWGSQSVYSQILSQSVAKNRNIKTGDPMIDLRVTLNVEGVPHYYNTRRLIYITFINSELDYAKDELYIINKDGDGYNNRVNNLKAVTRQEKSRRAFERGRVVESHLKTADRSQWKNYGGYARRKPVKQYQGRKLVARYESVSEAARKTGYGEKEIIMVAKGRWTHYHGFRWSYATA
ncbi:NUMOD4 domain-containing protein [Filimonas effusa]|uniref:NUMOD4 domain-containing protein n=1 Tax=Filimonas effusa TaxID=2508721 RepID=A0A4V1MAU9_9BACT|nr:NUMOD4 domain-containing protein [Filimonas effusa]RXK87136.1 hypothetical protein ESB13_10260 [Filimonas effusa]